MNELEEAVSRIRRRMDRGEMPYGDDLELLFSAALTGLALAWDEGYDEAMDDIGASLTAAAHGEDLNPYRSK